MSEGINAVCDRCGLKTADGATEDRPCPNCVGTLVIVNAEPAEAPAPTAEEAWEALSDDDQLAVLEYLADAGKLPDEALATALDTMGAGTF